MAARRATLDDVFFALTGHAAEDGATNGEAREPDGSGTAAGDGRQAGAAATIRRVPTAIAVLQEAEG